MVRRHQVQTRLDPVSTVPVARSRPWLGRALALVALAVAITILKPWGDAASSEAGRRSDAGPSSLLAAGPRGSAAGVPSEAPSARPSPGPGEIPCTSVGWEIVSLDRLANWTARSWTPMLPVQASGPLDATIREIPLSSSALLAVGACAPAAGPDGRSPTSATAAVVAAWRRDGAAARPLALELVGQSRADAGLALLYRPSGSTGSREPWPAGHFVLELAPVDAEGRPVDTPGTLLTEPASRWFIGLDVAEAP